MTAIPDRLTRLARALAVATTRPPVATASVPLQLRNPLNGGGLSTSRGARMASNTRRKAERAKGWALAERMTGGRFAMTIDCVVVLTRISPKPFDDDNNAAALKSMRDGMAEAWGINDADPRVTWVTDWRKGKAHVVEAALWVVPEVMPPPGRFVQDFDADDYNGRPPRMTDAESGMSPCAAAESMRRRETRATPNFIRAKGGV